MSEDLRTVGNPGSDDFRLDAYPFYLLNRAASRYNMKLEAQLRRIGVDIPTWRALMVLGDREPLAIGQVARSAAINLSTMMRIVERMAKAGLVETGTSETDGRVTEIRMTPEGRAKLAEARGVAAPLYEKIIGGFSASDFSRMLELLGRLYDNLD
ncbi:MarR family winged helix-turn-helix transcriptional regulator [Novosphingobium kaempferiae]|uniref:MarR family winged helix-turn-helix transcriptional regulator n=1 Tax=Novosphingobium kaempferiae TaxID=2896849 RepID=UPI001E5A1FE6|nr:MarR family winged helix-turn-helix transcriptional regulator [Novosphingobium kaempferiae]